MEVREGKEVRMGKKEENKGNERKRKETKEKSKKAKVRQGKRKEESEVGGLGRWKTTAGEK